MTSKRRKYAIALILITIGFITIMRPGLEARMSPLHTATTTAADAPGATMTAPPPANEKFYEDLSLLHPVSISGNPIVNPSFEIADAKGMPEGWLQGHQGTNTASFSYPVPGHSGRAAQVSIFSYTSGDAKWYFNDIPASGGQAYAFSDYYESNTSTYVTAQFTSANGTLSWMDIAHLPPSATWTAAAGAFYVPDGTVALTVFHLLKGVGTLVTDDYSLEPVQSAFPEGVVSINFDDGWLTGYTVGFPILRAARIPATYYIISRSLGSGAYMTEEEARILQAAGEEIGAHTRTHPDLTTLSPQDIEDQIAGSLADLRALGFSVSTFAYPYGAFNAETDAVVRQTGFVAARTTEPALNFPESNRLLLKARTIMNDTPVSEVESWINEAVKDKQWLILVFHELNTNFHTGDSYSWSSGNFQKIVDYLAKNRVPVATNAEVVQKYFSK